MLTVWLMYALLSAGGNAPVAVPSPDCVHSQVAARIVNPVMAAPESFLNERITDAKVKLVVQLNAHGAVQTVTTLGSSDSTMMDRLATQFAIHSRYTPELRGCTPVWGMYELDVAFMTLTASDGGTQVETYGRLIGAACPADRPVARLGMGDLGSITVPHGLLGKHGTVVVDVAVDAQGQPLSSVVSTSSGLAALDTFAQRAAMNSAYAPAISRCAPAAGSSSFLFRFNR